MSFPVSADDFSDPIEMELMLEDKVDENSFQDLNRLWMGETDNHLVFLVSLYNNSNPISVYLNVTLRDQAGNSFLIMVWYNNDTYSVSITEAISLTDPRIPSDNSLDESYITRQIFYDWDTFETGFYVNYEDISGDQEYDVILWSLMESEEGSDRLPNSSFLSFDTVSTPDRTFDFQAAMNGDFEVNYPDDPITTSPDPSISSEKPTLVTTEPIPPDESNPIGIIILTAFAIGLFLLYMRWRSSPQYPSDDGYPVKPSKSTEGTLKPAKSAPPSFLQPKPEGPVQMKYIEELGREVRMCCFQTARLNETYCYCGRAIEQDILDLFEASED